jgi:dipeptidyl-peptidase 4
MKMVVFTDSDHGFSYNGASAYRYRFQTKQLWEEVQRDPEETELVHQWSKKAFTA